MKRAFFIGAVDSGKSTILGQLLLSTNQLRDDEIKNIDRESQNLGRSFDLSLATDGLESEQNQAITMDIAFKTIFLNQRRWQCIDCPGHLDRAEKLMEGASLSDIACLVLDATKADPKIESLHASILRFLSPLPIIVLFNKIDIKSYHQDDYQNQIANFKISYPDLAQNVLAWIPISARMGDNISNPGSNSSWYKGPSLADTLAATPDKCEKLKLPNTFLIQIKSQDFVLGSVLSGQIQPGTILTDAAKRNYTVASLFKGEKKIEISQAEDSAGCRLIPSPPALAMPLLFDAKNDHCVSRSFAKIFLFSALPEENEFYLFQTGIKTKIWIDSIDLQGTIGLCTLRSNELFFAPTDNHHPLATFSLFSTRQQKVFGMGNFVLAP